MNQTVLFMVVLFAAGCGAEAPSGEPPTGDASSDGGVGLPRSFLDSLCHLDLDHIASQRYRYPTLRDPVVTTADCEYTCAEGWGTCRLSRTPCQESLRRVETCGSCTPCAPGLACNTTYPEGLRGPVAFLCGPRP